MIKIKFPLKKRNAIAREALKIMKEGVDNKDKLKIFVAYCLLNHVKFKWDGLETMHAELESLEDEAYSIMNDFNS